jgi:hypothetical protein
MKSIRKLSVKVGSYWLIGALIARASARQHRPSVGLATVFAAKDSELLQDLIRAAVNEACRRVDEELAFQEIRSWSNANQTTTCVSTRIT